MDKNKIIKLNIVILFLMMIIVSLTQGITMAAHTHVYAYQNQGDYHTVYCNVCGEYISERANHVYGDWETIRYATCTEVGQKARDCQCGATETAYIPMLDHTWVDKWTQSDLEHWKKCNNCNSVSELGTHYDNDLDGYCEVCNFLMALPATAEISDDVAVKEGKIAEFSIKLKSGTPPVSYQWYWNDSDSTENAVAIDGATTTDLIIDNPTENMDGRYYFCALINKAGTRYSPMARLTVYYPFTISEHPQPSANLKVGETVTLSVGVGKDGNPNKYTYQWYIADSETAEGSRLNGATKDEYIVSINKDVHGEYYYCVISNGQYEIASDRAKIIADVSLPEVHMGEIVSERIINNKAKVVIPLYITDDGEGYTETGENFTASDVIVKVGGVVPNNLIKGWEYIGHTDGRHEYELTLENINGNGELTLDVPEKSFEDNFHNTNIALEKPFETNIKVDNKAPVINFEEIKESGLESGLKGVYANKEDTLIIILSITEANEINTELFENKDEDIVVKVNGVDSNTDIEKKITYLEKKGNNKYLY